MLMILKITRKFFLLQFVFWISMISGYSRDCRNTQTFTLSYSSLINILLQLFTSTHKISNELWWNTFGVCIITEMYFFSSLVKKLYRIYFWNISLQFCVCHFFSVALFCHCRLLKTIPCHDIWSLARIVSFWPHVITLSFDQQCAQNTIYYQNGISSIVCSYTLVLFLL